MQLITIQPVKKKKMSRSRKRSGSKAQFPVRLHDMMDFVEANKLESVISWELGGRGFMIHDPDKLVEILQMFFGQTKYTSFRRQLNMWHFERIAHGPSKGVFLHPYFVKDNRELCGLMSRQIGLSTRDSMSSKSSTSRRTPSPPIQNSVKGEELGAYKSEIFKGSSCNADSTSRLATSRDSTKKLSSASSFLPMQKQGAFSSGPTPNQYASMPANPMAPSRSSNTFGSSGNPFHEPMVSLPSWPISTAARYSSVHPPLDNEPVFDLEPAPIGPPSISANARLESFAKMAATTDVGDSTAHEKAAANSAAAALPMLETTSSKQQAQPTGVIDESNPFAFEEDELQDLFSGRAFFPVGSKEESPPLGSGRKKL